ncbi:MULTISPECIES: hypothetical protein [Bradyrhizobium]|uniref:hypothetical protein n=1 Tax=Bradyrhizobium TaxID=374 RepID=UPI000A435A56|nr:hypothetical protein [Bradyrhizobium diazoefficiens]MBP1062106.1 putative membrane protein [Bradyrhizobium japonicum]AWO94305.2 hypothetical protein DI395_41335 [Bradyrhizobium diazoefficiens]QLD40901.1 hypothetical protein HUW42_07885 [Bradyrhizobium diazoefficiens]WLA75315.1 hypothetical protein QIH77_09065 [Bradyrhizobium diazoefficiens]WLB39747.1 hypothetical protein QIH78_08135 [Bradyrhizobium diazoefficiens]
MQDDQHAPAKPQLEFKEVAVLIPLIGTAIAISYDVGYFYGLDIKLFTLFSITEHVVFALEATPVAFVLAIFLIAYLGPGLDVLLGVKVHTAGKNMHKTKRRYVDAAIPAGLVLLVGVALYFSFFGLIAGLIAGAAVTFVPLVSHSQKVSLLDLWYFDHRYRICNRPRLCSFLCVTRSQRPLDSTGK